MVVGFAEPTATNTTTIREEKSGVNRLLDGFGAHRDRPSFARARRGPSENGFRSHRVEPAERALDGSAYTRSI